MMTQWSTLVSCVRAPNPSTMTLEGTNSLVVRAPESDSVIIVDPGPLDTDHVRRLTSYGSVEIILLTHSHPDHCESVDELHRITGAPVRAAHSSWVRGAAVLGDGDRVSAAGCTLTVLATPGHSADSVCFFLADDRVPGHPDHNGTVLTGDTILGRGSTVIDPTGTLGDYFESLRRIARLGSARIIPAHGDPRDDARSAAAALLHHRIDRLEQIDAFLHHTDQRPVVSENLVNQIVSTLYAPTDPVVEFAARLSVAAQVEFLARFSIPKRIIAERSGERSESSV